MTQFSTSSLLLCILLRQSHVAQASSDGDTPQNWYTKYDSYPQYCSTPDEMDARSIPPLQNDYSYGETRLLHVTALIRHGARTPWASNEDCFPKFQSSPELTEWNCKLTTIMTPPSPEAVVADKGNASKWKALDTSLFLYEKIYDALPYLKDGISNELNGTCQLGQLLLRGYEQQLANGIILRQAYTYRYNEMKHDERMRLIELSRHEFSAWDPQHLRYRSDHDQRTIMSGQVFLRGLFDEEVQAYFTDTGNYPTIPLHIADRARDILGPNPKVCPRLKDIADRAEKSEEYQAFNNSEETQSIREFMKEEVGDMNQDKILDCLMTAICTDRDLPEPLGDFGKEDSWFQKLAEYDIQSYNKVLKYNDSEYSKLAMGPLWAEIKDIWKFFMNNQNIVQSGDMIPPRLALFSGHDTTIMPVLASLSPDLLADTHWSPYASMLLIEIHEFIDGMSNTTVFKSPYAFRLIYNGIVLTDDVPGCYSGYELCDMQILKALIEPFATRGGDCTAKEKEDPDLKVTALAETFMKTTEGIFIFIGLVLLGCTIGALLSFVFLTGKICGKRVLSSAVVEDAGARIGLQQGQYETAESAIQVEDDGFEDEPVFETHGNC